jgi:sulfhydrogenase subunit beta (sulfur reductase)
MYTISELNLINGFSKLNEKYPLVIPQKQDDEYYLHFSRVKAWNQSKDFFSPIRTPQPLKSLFYPPRQSAAIYPEKSDNPETVEPYVIIGHKSCDIHALKIIDKVYIEGEFPDPYYKTARQKHILISTDCLEAGDYCYCTLMNCQPYPKSDYDLNLSKIDNQYLIAIGTDRGKEILHNFFKDFSEAPDTLIQKREEFRENLTNEIIQKNSKFRFRESHRDAIERHLDSIEWADLSKTCVECGTCTQICPTCHCFLMFDQPIGKRFQRIKIWDSCFFAGYSRMAGGLTPRLKLADRFKNRFYHKFDSFVTNFGVEACTGCGRCVEGCMGKIDLREVLLELEKRVVLKENIDLI